MPVQTNVQAPATSALVPAASTCWGCNSRQRPATSSVLVSPATLWEGAMKRHFKEGREPVKARSRKAVPKRRNGPKVSRTRASSAASLHKQVALLTHERDEALARQNATADILRVISQSPNDERPIFANMSSPLRGVHRHHRFRMV